LRFTPPDGGAVTEMGLGSRDVVSVGQVRDKAQAAREFVAAGINPIVARKAGRQKQRSCPTFGKVAGELIAAKQPGWRSTIHAALPATAARLRGRVEAVLDYAKAKGWRSGENPAMWRGHLEHLLPRRQKLQKLHNRAMAYRDIPEFIAGLREHPDTPRLAPSAKQDAPIGLKSISSGRLGRSRRPE
jgi:hypothetical protein